MAETSQVSRYRPAVLAITGLAAACSIYYLFSSRFPQLSTKTALQRSNAIHRPRINRSNITIEWVANPAASLGELVIRRGDQSVVTDLAGTGLPNMEDLQQTFGTVPDDIWKEIERALVDGVLRACVGASGAPLSQQDLHRVGLGSLIDAMADHSVDRIRDASHNITSFLGSVRPEAVDQAVDRFLLSEAWLSGQYHAQPVGDNGPAETEIPEDSGEPSSDSQGLKRLLYYIAAGDIKRRMYEHRGIRCEGCGTSPIRGFRWHCLNCPDYDLCTSCEGSTRHPKTHIFAKITIPLPVLSQPTSQLQLWYPGDPRKLYPTFNQNHQKLLAEKYHVNCNLLPKVEAWYEQFTSLANVPWPEDPLEIKCGIDVRAFRKALSSERWPHRFRPNVLYDRIFAFYDTNEDGIIGFEEFVSGLAYLRGERRFASLDRALKGFDIDGNGFIDRNDFIRILRAKFEIHKFMVEEMTTRYEKVQTSGAMTTVRSSQPISSIFTAETIPPGEERPRHGKTIDNHGDMQPWPETKTVLEDHEGWPYQGLRRRRSRRRNRHLGQAQQRLQDHLSRFEELLQSPSEEPSVSLQDEVAEFYAPDEIPAAISDYLERRPDLRNPIHQNFPLNQDILWGVIEDGYNAILDPLFRRIEDEDKEAVETKDERRRWEKEIADAERRLKAVRDYVENATADPLIATALGKQDPKFAAGILAWNTFAHEMSRTDTAALERREAEIAQQSLGALLDSTGYSVMETQSTGTTDAETGTNSDASIQNTATTVAYSEPQQEDSIEEMEGTRKASDTGDPTMPQNRPNSTQPIKVVSTSPVNPPTFSRDRIRSGSEASTELPSDTRLERLSVLSLAEERTRRRGGPGRLSLVEIEAILQGEQSQDLRGLVVAWLEWAGF